LPHAGQGTLKERLKGVLLRAKTGTLTDASALTGWVWLERADRWAEFSIMSSGYDDTAAKDVEDRIVRVIANYATAPRA
jgi:D-alanyl-D-alanine carboxypeptidase/D-alanyl-D-alanine-endopeptidase (penicillin-binding protein 4)